MVCGRSRRHGYRNIQIRWNIENKQRGRVPQEKTRAQRWWVEAQGTGSSLWRCCWHGPGQDRQWRGPHPAPLRRTRAARQKLAYSHPPAGSEWLQRKACFAIELLPIGYELVRHQRQKTSASPLSQCQSGRTCRHWKQFLVSTHHRLSQRDIHCTPRKCPLGIPNLRGWHQTRCRGPASRVMYLAQERTASVVAGSLIAAAKPHNSEVVKPAIPPAPPSSLNIDSLLLFSNISLIFRLAFSLIIWWTGERTSDRDVRSENIYQVFAIRLSVTDCNW